MQVFHISLEVWAAMGSVNGSRRGSPQDLEPASVSTGEPLLHVESVDFSYGHLQVLFDVSLTVPEQGRVALLGTNGAGKSTLLRVIAGLGEAKRGRVWFKGEEITDIPAENRVARGMTLVEGGRATFSSLSVLDNLRLGAYTFRTRRALVQERLDEVISVFPQLELRLAQSAGTLSGGEQQMMALGRAMVAGSEFLMIDELSLGLAPIVMDELVHALERLVSTGRSLLLVEQSLNVALGLVQQAYFMEKGSVRFSGPAHELLERGDLVRSVFFGKAETAS